MRDPFSPFPPSAPIHVPGAVLRQPECARRIAKARGFTLVELMITVVVIAVLATVALPSLMGAIRKGRRSEAIAALSAVQQAEERFRANNLTYTADLTDPPTGPAGSRGLGLQAVTPSNYYTVELISDTISNVHYEATATANAGTTQIGDGHCAKLGVMMHNGNITYAGGDVGSTFTAASYSANNPCWAR
jgi:type IV pilus assembly protein PilE